MTSVVSAALHVTVDSICRQQCYRCGLIDPAGRVRLVALDIVAFVWLCGFCAVHQAGELAEEISA